MRRVLLALLVALAAAAPAAAQTPLERGRELYGRDCVWCHGPDGRGVDPSFPREGPGDNAVGGPPLVGTGARGAHFYLTTGYMPLDDPRQQPTRDGVGYTDAEVDALVAFVARFGGPEIPAVDPDRGDAAEGMRLYTEYCAGCHQIVGEGGIVPGGVPPPLKRSTPTQIAEAIRIGPFLMPSFSESVLDEREVDSIVAYLLVVRQPEDRGGWGIGHIGPIPEGLVAWLLAGAALIAVAVVIGQRAE